MGECLLVDAQAKVFGGNDILKSPHKISRISLGDVVQTTVSLSRSFLNQ